MECENNLTRFPLTVTIPASFGSLAGAKVRLVTEEAVYEKTPAPGDTTVVFPDAVFSAANAGLTAPAFQWVVSALNREGGTENKCVVTNSSGTNPPGDPGASPAAPATFPTVGSPAGAPAGSPCTFTIGGSVAYSLPSTGGTAPAMPAGGVTLQLRDVLGTVVETLNVPAYGNFTFGGATPRRFASNSSAVYDVAVSAHPDGQFCVVGNGGSANLYTAGVTNPLNITQTATTTNNSVPGGAAIPWAALNVFCRNLPASTNQLTGTYRLTTAAATIVSATTTTVVTSIWRGYDLTLQNTASSNFMTFFADGTFLYGTHAASTQVEHGFYEYNPAAGTLRFTIVTDSGSGNQTTFPTSFVPNQPTTPGLSAAPGPLVVGASTYRAMGSVQKIDGNPKKITGIFGPYGTTTPTTGATRLTWELTEPPSIDGQMTGTWASEDHRRVWIYDFLTAYGTHIGANGGAANMQDACFAVQDVVAPQGFYTRRAISSGCYPYLRPVPGVAVLIQQVELIDYQNPDAVLATSFIGGIPGGKGDPDGRSPSPTEYAVAPAGSFFSAAPARYFSPAIPTGWCTADLFGARSTLHGEPIEVPVYFCRTRAN